MTRTADARAGLDTAQQEMLDWMSGRARWIIRQEMTRTAGAQRKPNPKRKVVEGRAAPGGNKSLKGRMPQEVISR